MENELLRLQRCLRASGLVYKVLDEHDRGLLKDYFEGRLHEAQRTHNRFIILGSQIGRTAAAADAMEEMNKYVSLLELIL